MKIGNIVSNTISNKAVKKNKSFKGYTEVQSIYPSTYGTIVTEPKVFKKNVGYKLHTLSGPVVNPPGTITEYLVHHAYKDENVNILKLKEDNVNFYVEYSKPPEITFYELQDQFNSRRFNPEIFKNQKDYVSEMKKMYIEQKSDVESRYYKGRAENMIKNAELNLINTKIAVSDSKLSAYDRISNHISAASYSQDAIDTHKSICEKIDLLNKEIDADKDIINNLNSDIENASLNVQNSDFDEEAEAQLVLAQVRKQKINYDVGIHDFETNKTLEEKITDNEEKLSELKERLRNIENLQEYKEAENIIKNSLDRIKEIYDEVFT